MWSFIQCILFVNVFKLPEAGCVSAETCRIPAQIKTKWNCYADCIVYCVFSHILHSPSLDSILSLMIPIKTSILYFCNIHLGFTFCHTRGSLHTLQDTILCALVISASELSSFCMIDDYYRRYLLLPDIYIWTPILLTLLAKRSVFTEVGPLRVEACRSVTVWTKWY